MSLLGLVRHMTEVERHWFRQTSRASTLGPLYWTDASPDGDFDDVDAATAEADFAAYAEEVDAARAVQAAHELDDTFVRHRPTAPTTTVDLRALVLHMIEEYARHNGHADLLREVVDGRTGE